MSGRTGSGPIPAIIYGTAWKKERTKKYVIEAALAGYRAIDTACQPKHYNEAGVGFALADLHNTHGISRSSLFLQTKYTPQPGHDSTQPLPYDADCPIWDQVHQSFQTSSRNLQTSYVDAYFLHGPLQTMGQTLEAWAAMEDLYDSGQVRSLGMSNMYSLAHLKTLVDGVRVKPLFLQNRFYADTGFDSAIREFCRQNGIYYQSFWTLSANQHIVKGTLVGEIAERLRATNEQVWFRFVMGLGIIPLTGTTNIDHMKQDLDAIGLNLSDQDHARMYHLLTQ